MRSTRVSFFGLDTEAYGRTYSDRELIRRILGYFAPHRRDVFVVAGLITACRSLTRSNIATAGAVQPFVVARGLDALLKSPTSALVLGLVAVVAIIGALN